MTALKLIEAVSVEDYLEGEKHAPVKHEYVHGRVFALAGTSDTHNRISINLIVGLDDASRRKGCQLFAAELKLSIFGERYYYPDLMVTCEPEADPYIKEKPCLIIEILSRLTAATDRREKVDAYLSLPTLYSYVLVDSQMKKVEAFTRMPEGWREQHWQGEGVVPFGCLGTTLSLDAIYRGLDLPDDTEPLG
jgi:Uma2 family endonuclease